MPLSPPRSGSSHYPLAHLHFELAQPHSPSPQPQPRASLHAAPPLPGLSLSVAPLSSVDPRDLRPTSLLSGKAVMSTASPMLTLTPQHDPHLSIHSFDHYSRHPRQNEPRRQPRSRASPPSRRAYVDQGPSPSRGIRGVVSFRGDSMDTYHGHVRTPADAIVLFEACRLGLLPRVQRRLSEKERQSIKSGSVFVWDEREAGMRRWTDGKSWSASRVSGSFLTYREMEGKRGGGGNFGSTAPRNRAGKSPNSGRGSDSDVDMNEDGPDGYRYKPDGLMKQSFSITTSTGQHLHLISYYSRTHPSAASLNQPSNDPNLRNIRPQKGMYPESTVQDQPSSAPASTRGGITGAYAPSPHAMSMAGSPAYSRPGATPPTNFPGHPGYNWPSSPASTSSPLFSPGPFGPPLNQLSVPNGTGAGGGSPLLFNRAQPPPGPLSSATLLPESTLPPLSTSGNHRLSGPANGSVQRLPNFIASVSPRGAPAAPVLQQTDCSTTSPRISMAPIDPRLTGMPLRSGAKSFPSDERPSSGVSKILDPAEGNPQIQIAGATNIPSIGSLMNVTAADNVDAMSDRSNSRAPSRGGSRSPGGSQKIKGPQDIPSEKLSFGEDMRALRVLDRAFSA